MPDYIALMRKETGTDYGVDFPDFPGCVSGGRTLDEARRNASEALAFHIDGMLDDGEAIPEPTELGSVMADSENRDAVAVLVAATAPAAKPVRVNITIERDLLARIDAAAGPGKRSRFLAEGARRLLREATG